MTMKKLPEGWRWVKLYSACEQSIQTRDPRSEPAEPFTYIDIGSIDNTSKRIVQPKTLLGADAPSRARKVVHARDVIVSTTRPNLNAVAMVPSELDDQICSTGFCVLRPKHDLLDSSYLYAFVQHPGFVNQLSQLVVGALYPAVTNRQVFAQSIPLPPLPEQKRIAALLTEKMATIDQARAAAQAQLETAQALPAAYLRAVFNNPEAQKWPRKQVIDWISSGVLSHHQDGNHGELYPRTRDFVPTGVKFLSAKHITREGGLDFASAPCISKEQAAGIRIGFAQADDVLLAHNATVGPVALVPSDCEPFIVGTSLTIYRCNPDDLLPRFLFYALQAPQFQSQLDDAMKQTTRNQVPITRQRLLHLSIPPITEQERILAELPMRFEQSEGILATSEEQLEAINTLPAAYLRQAFNGEL